MSTLNNTEERTALVIGWAHEAMEEAIFAMCEAADIRAAVVEALEDNGVVATSALVARVFARGSKMTTLYLEGPRGSVCM